MVLGPKHQADPLMAERGQVGVGLAAAVTSSVDTRGKSRLSMAAFISTVGTPRLRSSR